LHDPAVLDVAVIDDFVAFLSWGHGNGMGGKQRAGTILMQAPKRVAAKWRGVRPSAQSEKSA
jgi:hypothetical protein